MTPDLNAVLFDADGVFQRVLPDVHDRLTRAAGGSAGDFEACVADIFAAEETALTGAADFTAALTPVLAKWRSTSDVQALLEEWFGTIETDQSILALIADLRRSGVYCAVASNQERHRARHMSQALAYSQAFDREFYSCHLGHAKPSPTYFHEIVRLAELDPARTLFIDDRAENVAAAREAGLHAEVFVLTEVGQGAEPMRRLLTSYGLG